MPQKYSTPINWLYQKIVMSTDTAELRAHALTLLQMVDNDQVQDMYQREMDLDGYFESEGDDDESATAASKV